MYGERIKLNPADHGLALVAWGLPVVAVIAGAAGVVVALRRWSREPRLPATAEDEVLVARARETGTPRGPMSDQTALESERDFLLRSLDDLESERDAGNIDDETYRTLHEDYTARAAVVIRSLRDDVAPVLPEAPRDFAPREGHHRRRCSLRSPV